MARFPQIVDNGTSVTVDGVLTNAELRASAVSVTSPTRSYSYATGSTGSSGDQTLVTAPAAGSRLVVKELIVQNESATDTTIILKSGSTSRWRALLSGSNKGALVLTFADGEEWRLGTAEALVLNLSGANSHGYTVRYYTEVV